MLLEGEPSTSVSTIRGLHRLDTAIPFSMSDTSSERYSEFTETSRPHSPSLPSSPHSVLPSPSSPSGDSVSSFPSVSSSFLFSSGPGSPPQLPLPDSHGGGELHDSTRGLIIPSLALPSPARRPTAYGQTLGDLRLLILAPRRAASSTAALVDHLLEENEDVVDIGPWEEQQPGGTPSDEAADDEKITVRRASTHWVEHRDAHGLERIEPARNVEIAELPGYDSSDDAEDIVRRTLPVIHAPFRQVFKALNPDCAPNTVLASLLSSSTAPLYTAMILLLTSSPTQTEKVLMDALSPHVPLIVIPPLPDPPSYPFYTPSYSSYPHTADSSAFASPVHPPESSSPSASAPLSAFRPSSPEALRAGLFRTPESLAHLRAEGVARFLRWREVERAVERINQSYSVGPTKPARMEAKQGMVSGPPTEAPAGGQEKIGWNKAQWEAEWEGTLSEDIAVALRQRRRAETVVASRLQCEQDECSLDDRRPPVFSEMQIRRMRRPSQACAPAAFDPLHARSLFMFSLSLLQPLRARLMYTLSCGRFGIGSRDTREESAVEETEGRAQEKTAAAQHAEEAKHGAAPSADEKEAGRREWLEVEAEKSQSTTTSKTDSGLWQPEYSAAVAVFLSHPRSRGAALARTPTSPSASAFSTSGTLEAAPIVAVRCAVHSTSQSLLAGEHDVLVPELARKHTGRAGGRRHRDSMHGRT
ncbi:uncharacterized protein FIBRA_02866 [Fibroporia radiculosa]|uniref:Uncharacterized protein n=1 Tax=Fibroporia radiculosa TaxID=599839 RepID=J4H233_9APHY|nr:uncharacterized protein FIBRA_02866 [Fibroporia radiculosa]CCM00824.1 predicted protein [Fibroporia radiculosa]